MRKFGNKQEFFRFQLEGSDETYQVPLAVSMPIADLLAMQKAEGTSEGFAVQVGVLRNHMGDVVDKLPATTLGDILKAWAEESMAAGATAGESSALSE